MDAIKLLEGLLGNNATGSKRIEQTKQSSGGGGMAAILGSILGGGGGGASSGGGGGGGGGLSDLLGGLLGGGGSAPAAPQPPAPRQPSRQEQDQAEVLIRAMCNAAKVDGDIDQKEQEAILGRLGDVSESELGFVRKELSSPLDVSGFCRSVPREAAQQVYGFSVMAIEVDTLAEAAYLGRLAEGLGLDPRVCNQLHEQVGAPALYC